MRCAICRWQAGLHGVCTLFTVHDEQMSHTIYTLLQSVRDTTPVCGVGTRAGLGGVDRGRVHGPRGGERTADGLGAKFVCCAGDSLAIYVE